MGKVPKRSTTALVLMTTVLLSAGVSSVRADQAQVTITKMPLIAGTQTFDPRRPPRERPTLTPPEEAVCASDFLSDASVGGQAEQTDATHAKLTINKIKVTLQLNITILGTNESAQDDGGSRERAPADLGILL